jgi:hypothetical protein
MAYFLMSESDRNKNKEDHKHTVQTIDAKQQVKDYVTKNLLQKGKRITLSDVALRISNATTINSDLLTIRDAMLELEREGKLRRVEEQD